MPGPPSALCKQQIYLGPSVPMCQWVLNWGVISCRQEQGNNSFKDKQKPALESTAQLVAHWCADWQTYRGCLQEFKFSCTLQDCQQVLWDGCKVKLKLGWTEKMERNYTPNYFTEPGLSAWLVLWVCWEICATTMNPSDDMHDPNYWMKSVQCTVTCSSPPPAHSQNSN